MARDNFTKAVIEKLQKRVANRCSNPDCRVPTIGPSSATDKTLSIGIAAHITAASSGGPRFDSSLTDKQRKSMENGIWLCSNCSIAIDKDISRYPVQLLKEWKYSAEELARKELGQKLPKASDAINTLTSALTGKPSSFILDAIQNTHLASTSALENLDPRFSVRSEYMNGMTHFEILPKVEVPLTLNIVSQRAKDFSEQFNNLINHGSEISIDGEAITIEGSKLFKELTSNLTGGNLKLIPTKRKATQKIWLLNKETSVIESFDDIIGSISPGKQSFTFNGSACNEIFVFSYQHFFDNKNQKAKVNITINFNIWSAIDVRALPYFGKIYSLFEKLHEGWSLFTALEINGTEIFRSKETNVSDYSFPKEIIGTLNIVRMAKTLATALNINIAFNPTYSFSNQEYSDFCEAVSIANGIRLSKHQLQTNLRANIAVEGNNVTSLRSIKEPIDMTIISFDEKEIHLFGQKIKLPPINIEVKAAIPSITSTKPFEELTDGDVVNIEWFPSENFECHFEFQSNSGASK